MQYSLEQRSKKILFLAATTIADRFRQNSIHRIQEAVPCSLLPPVFWKLRNKFLIYAPFPANYPHEDLAFCLEKFLRYNRYIPANNEPATVEGSGTLFVGGTESGFPA
ncbi:hypothetical protein NIES22_20340 [Calothrix brevissima NIES-22]|nr:hypothetical protein NIES22_20340 [Calothrix brevissima NIES-22]